MSCAGDLKPRLGISYDDYVRSQHRAINELVNGNELSRPVLMFSTERKINHQEMNVGGFADRIKGALSGYLFGLLTNRSYFIRWERPIPLRRDFKQRKLLWQITPDVERALAKLEMNTVDLIDIELDGARRSSFEQQLHSLAFLPKDRHVRLHTNSFMFNQMIVGGHGQELAAMGVEMTKESLCFQSCFNRLFEYNPDGSTAIRYQRFMSWKGRQSQVVGLQIRTGGDGDWNDPEMFSKLRWEIAAEAVENFVRLNRLGNVGVFITTDSDEIKSKIAERLSRKLDVFYFLDRALHLERSAENETRERAPVVALENSLLSECDFIVVGKGGFGTIAAWRKGRDPDVIFV